MWVNGKQSISYLLFPHLDMVHVMVPLLSEKICPFELVAINMLQCEQHNILTDTYFMSFFFFFK